jgi:hypothetical protein
VALKGGAVAERLQAPAEGQLFGVEGLLQKGKEQPTEETSEHADGQKEVGPAGDPTAAVGRETAAGNDAMQVRMMEQLYSWRRSVSLSEWRNVHLPRLFHPSR